ncbi:T7-like phage DNA polymerase [Celeribacter phage P12053L]|uniref:T7-like phage DNA polymerase n=1 Tax=Celeribacter phage P12053L TaxID=1197951 RepID=I6RT10_9CAUD|nr:DNA polymerase I [Celeribacter phage P12053L]AFM54628.1 T7-like phage DNA polymerase [Celeribacter phage P12053L]
MEVVFDIETDSLDATVIHVLVAKRVGQKGFYVIRDAETFKRLAKQVTLWIGHNVIGFDIPQIKKLWGYEIPLKDVADTLVMSRLADPTRKGGHSLDTLSGNEKIDFHDFSTYTPEMLAYCKQDVAINEKVYLQLKDELSNFGKASIQLEHQMQAIVCEQEKNGFMLDTDIAEEIYTTCLRETNRIEAEIKEFMVPIAVPDKEVIIKRKKDGSIYANQLLEGCNVQGDYTKIDWEEFNLGSPAQVNKRLDRLGWKPYIKTKSGNSYKICPENLATISDTAPEAVKGLKAWKVLETRWKLAQEWLQKSQATGRVHGRVILTGAVTHRAAHQGPNMANIPSVPHGKDGILWKMEGMYGAECRQAFKVPEGKLLVGTDAAGIQLRVLAHYMNDPIYTEQVIDGDIHTFNKEALGRYCKDRPTAKTFIYAFLLGAGTGMISSILGCNNKQANEAMANFYEAIPALKKLKSQASQAASMGWMKGLDGRVLRIGSDHLALSVYLQGGETVIMRLANVFWQRQAKKEGINFKQCAWVHDEWQTEVDEDQAQRLGEIQVQAIKDAGTFFKLNCPMDGEAKIGKSWLDTH